LFGGKLEERTHWYDPGTIYRFPGSDSSAPLDYIRCALQPERERHYHDKKLSRLLKAFDRFGATKAIEYVGQYDHKWSEDEKRRYRNLSHAFDGSLRGWSVLRADDRAMFLIYREQKSRRRKCIVVAKVPHIVVERIPPRILDLKREHTQKAIDHLLATAIFGQ
jgi:hypothetical protein